MKKVRLIALGLVFVMMLGACGSKGNDKKVDIKTEESQNNEKEDAPVDVSNEENKENAENTENTGTHKVVDHGGNEVEVPNEIKRVVIDQIPILSTYTAYFEGNAPYIVGFAGSFKDVISNTALKNIAPELLDADNTVYAQSDLNIEEIVKLNPDVIFYNAQNKQHAEMLKKSGIPAVGFATIGAQTPADPVERYKEWLRLLEDVFGEEGKMDKLIAAGEEITKEVEEKIKTVPEDKRPETMILWKYNNGIPMVSGKGSFGDFWLKRLGVKNVAGETEGFAKTTFEQIYKWDPEIMFLDGPGLMDMIPSDVFENKVEGADFAPLKAVQNKKVYNTTLGMWNWFTPNPDAPLVLAWLAKNTYPEVFEDYKLDEKIREYYEKAYGYKVTDDELKGMLDYNER